MFTRWRIDLVSFTHAYSKRILLCSGKLALTSYDIFKGISLAPVNSYNEHSAKCVNKHELFGTPMLCLVYVLWCAKCGNNRSSHIFLSPCQFMTNTSLSCGGSMCIKYIMQQFRKVLIAAIILSHWTSNLLSIPNLHFSTPKRFQRSPKTFLESTKECGQSYT